MVDASKGGRASKYVAYFTAGKELKASINGESAVPPPVSE